MTALTLSLTKLFVKEAVVVLPGREASVLLKPTVCLLNLRRRVREWGRWVGGVVGFVCGNLAHSYQSH